MLTRESPRSKPKDKRSEKMGRTLRVVRELYGIDQIELISAAGVSQPTWSRIEAGSRSIRDTELDKVLLRLGVSKQRFEGMMLRKPIHEAAIHWMVPCFRRAGIVVDADALMRWLEIDPAAAAPGSISTAAAQPVDGAGADMVHQVRKLWCLGDGVPVGDMSVLLGLQRVVLLPALVKKAGAGMLKFAGEEALGVIVVPDSKPSCFQRWEAAKMLYVLLCRFRGGKRGRSPSEADQTAFAQELLLPNTAMNAVLNWIRRHKVEDERLVVPTIHHVAAMFGVPRRRVWDVLAMRRPEWKARASAVGEDADECAPKAAQNIPPWLAFLRATARAKV